MPADLACTGFPEFKDNEFYITGESYAGQYIPTLMDQMHTKGGVANFRGAAVGNGVGGAHSPLPVIDTCGSAKVVNVFRLEIRMHPAQARAAQSAVLA